MNDKVVFFCGALKEGGAERVISILANRMSDIGRNVEILLYYDREVFYTLSSKVDVISVEKETGTKNLLKNLLWIRRYFRKCHGAICSFLAPFNILAILAGFGTRARIIVADRNDPRFVPGNKWIRKLRDFLYRFADCVVVQTQNNKSYFSDAVQKKCKIVYNPVDLKENAGLALRTEKKIRIVSVGRLMEQKNQRMLISAFAAVHNEFPEYELTIYGEGPCRNELEKQIEELGLKESVFLPGNKKNVHELIADAELFVLTSNYEGMPNALIEAMCLGLPVISTKVSGATDLVIDGENGALISVGDKEQLIKVLKELIVDSNKRKQYATMAMKLNEELNIQSIIDKWYQFL